MIRDTRLATPWSNPEAFVAGLALTGILAHLIVRFSTGLGGRVGEVPLWLVLAAGGLPLVLQLAGRAAYLPKGRVVACHVHGACRPIQAFASCHPR